MELLISNHMILYITFKIYILDTTIANTTQRAPW